MGAKLISEADTKRWLKALDVPWPAASEDADGTAFVALEEIEVRPQWEEFSWLGPRYPDRKVPTEWANDGDGDEWPIAWRELTDEEWEAALAAYEKALAEFHRTHGRMRRKTGPDMISAVFRTKSGGRARGQTYRGAKGWVWVEFWWP